MIHKRYRLQLDLDVTLHDMTAEKCDAIYERRREIWATHGFTDVPERVHDGPDRWAIESAEALKAAILNDPVLLDTWFRKSILLYAEDEITEANNNSPPDEDILHPAIESLPPRSRHWWRQTFAEDADDLTLERVEYLFQFLDIKCQPPTVQELEVDGVE